jgi:tetratricopeptide (TPR) repeat protein
VTSFETCYSKFPNKNGDATNLFHKRALLRWGEALQGSGKPAEAIRLFRKFMEERDKKRDTFDPGSYYVLLALCHFQLGEVTEGAENFETAVRNKARFGSPESGLIAALQAFVATAVAKKDESALVAFLSRNRDALAREPFEMEPYAGILVRMGTEAMGAGLDAAALALFELVPSSEKIAGDLRTRLAEEGRTDKATLEASLARLETLRRDGGTHDAIQWSALAVIQERKGDPKASFAAYEQLELHFPKGPQREENLYHLVRTASLAGNADAAENYGNRFLTTFPESKHAPEVRQSMLTALFNQGSYDRCLAAATALMPKLAEGTRDHDVCLHLLGGSQHRGGHFTEAQPLLDRHATLYPESPFRQESLALQAANLVRLQRWSEAAPLLDKIIATPGANPLLATTLLERARVHSAAGEHAAAV